MTPESASDSLRGDPSAGPFPCSASASYSQRGLLRPALWPTRLPSGACFVRFTFRRFTVGFPTALRPLLPQRPLGLPCTDRRSRWGFPTDRPPWLSARKVEPSTPENH